MAKIPQSNIAYNSDQVDAEEGQVLLEEKNKKRVRYWWEDGYVPGNEKDSDDESSASASGGETKDSESCKPPETNALPSLDPGEDSDYEAVVPGVAKGGRFVRWGGLHGRLCLADGALAVEDGDAGEVPILAAPPLQECLDELLMPGADAEDEEQAQAEEASRLALENAPTASAAETSAIVLYQTPLPKPWSFCTLTDHFSAAEVDQAEVRKMFAIEDSKPNYRLYTEEMQALSQVAIGNYLLRQQQGMEVVQKAKEDEAIRRRRVAEGAKEQLPGTKQPLAVSQAWQDHLGKGKETEEAEPPKPRQRKTLLPGSLSASSSSSSSQQPAKGGSRPAMPASGRPLLKEKLPGPRPGAAAKAMDSKYADAFDFEPTQVQFGSSALPCSRASGSFNMPIKGLADVAKDGEAGAKDQSPFGPGGIYHEKQVGSLCAIHCVNNMLQGPLYEDHDFRSVARTLDERERSLMKGADLDFGNARYDGFYNVQVVQEVLRRAGYEMTSVSAEAAKDGVARAKEKAFICNKQEHWFCVRRLGQEWFDLNSCMSVPKHYTDSDLEWLIKEAVSDGYSVFRVRGDFPKCALEDDHKKLVEAKEGCGGPRTGYSLYAGSGQTLTSPGAKAAAAPPSDAAALRAARLARLGGGGAAPSPPPA